MVSEPGALNYYIFFRPILLTLSAFRNLISTYFPLSGSLDSLLCDLIAPTPGPAFSLVMPRTLAAVSSFLSGRGYPFLNLLPPLSLLDPYSDYVEINISLNNSSSLSFLNACAPPIRSSPTDGRTNSFSSSIFSSSRNLFILRDFNCHHPLWDSRGTSEPRGEEVFDWVISSDLLSLNDLTYILFSIAPLAVALPLIYPLLPPLSPVLAHGRCFRTWVLITYQFFYLSPSLRSFAPTSVPLPSIFRKLAGMTLLFTLTLTVLLQRNTRLFLFLLLLLSSLLWH